MKQTIIDNLCYTALVYGRINKKLSLQLNQKEIEALLLKVLHETDEKFYIKTGKNFYISNSSHNIRVTVNSYTFRVITVDQLEKIKS
ncbi:DUF3781 domain-containing protein [Flammeovirga sp. SJP92]|uniref:DUF3781 domain-containing protein n=1 Tax=Flammeovirga sp. SJP92 TaxID=1775430 RepID=UPI00078809CC|nr:DUF3781 domain-containing protein [Flammeovirga sp. SJP92]KXX66891.1 hypothetical protein AVL50_30645 [Flammeovirga sp. SJP92]